MSKIIRVLLAMVMLFSAVFSVSAMADTNTITVTEATITNAGVVTVAGTTNSTGEVTLLVSKQAAAVENSDSLLTMAQAQMAYIDQASPDENGKFKFVFKPLGVTGDITTIFVCADGVAEADLSINNLAANTFTVNYEGKNVVYQSDNGVVKIDLRPATATDPETSKSESIATGSGYFKAWDFGSNKYKVENNIGGVSLPYVSGTVTATPEFYTVDNTVISSAQAQRVTLANNSKAIRFLALVDKTYTGYARAGFVFSTLGENPTIEAGYQPYNFNEIFKTIKYGENIFDVTNTTFTSKFTKAASMEPTGILYANVVIAEGSEDTTYYATPYVEKADGTRVYGSSKAISYSELVTLDEVK